MPPHECVDEQGGGGGGGIDPLLGDLLTVRRVGLCVVRMVPILDAGLGFEAYFVAQVCLSHLLFFTGLAPEVVSIRVIYIIGIGPDPFFDLVTRFSSSIRLAVP